MLCQKVVGGLAGQDFPISREERICLTSNHASDLGHSFSLSLHAFFIKSPLQLEQHSCMSGIAVSKKISAQSQSLIGLNLLLKPNAFKGHPTAFLSRQIITIIGCWEIYHILQLPRCRQCPEPAVCVQQPTLLPEPTPRHTPSGTY